MPTTNLPSDPSFENLKKQAKGLRKSVRERDAAAMALVREFHPRSDAALADCSLADAQLVLARQYRFPSWARLKEHLGVVELYTWAPGPEPANDPVGWFISLACLKYEDDRVSLRVQARQILAEHPEYARASIYAAATVGDVATTRAMLGKEPGLAKERGGPRRWEPLLYACYSRLDLIAPGTSTLEVARLLLQHGADPNAGFLWRGHYPFTALTGAFGEGENGATHQSAHQDWRELATVLLDAGADPNDSQTLYNRHFNRNDEHLKLLFAYGLGKDKGGPWLERLGERGTSPGRMLVEELWAAAGKNYAERVGLLVENGVEVNTPGVRNGRTPYEEAMLCGNREIAEYLVAHGARRMALSREEEFASACVAGDEERARELLRADPGLIDGLGAKGRADLLNRATNGSKYEGVRLMAALGFELSTAWRNTPLHQAAWRGDLEMAKLLLELGADPIMHEPTYNATPLGWAMHNHQPLVADYLMPMADIFDAVALGQVERVRALLDGNPGLANSRDARGQAPLYWLQADKQRVEEILKLLLAAGADINHVDDKDETTLDKLRAAGGGTLAELMRMHGGKTGAELKVAGREVKS